MLSGRGLRGTDLWWRYGRREPWVFAGVSLSVEPGQVVGLSGPSGAGKSTLASLLAGHRRPLRGTVTVDGEPLPRTGRRPVQLITQRPDTAMDPRWHIERVLAEAGAASADEEALVDPTWLDRFPHEISGGELQRVNLARAFRAEPAYVIADEISSSLDALTQAMLWERLLGRVATGALGVLAISHDDALLTEVADEVVGLEQLSGARGTV